MKILLPILLLLNAVCAFAQTDATFSVAKKKKVVIECKYDTLAGDKYYYFKAYGISTKEIIPGKFSGGEVWMNDTAVCIHTTNNTSIPKKHLLELFLRKDNSVIFSRNFTIMPAANIPKHIAATPNINVTPDVVFNSNVFFEGTRTSSKDSLLSKVNKMLTHLTPISRSKSKITIKVKLIVKCGEENNTYNSTELKTTAEMEAAIKNMDEKCHIILMVDYHSFSDPPEDSQMGPYRFDIR